ncbi:MAG: tetratricopeptide repeat protein, partial [SAR202 cluster bacterium]|nr:tetratricopeptide repeat protein [SAR202 cluster bacterium]
LGQMYRDGQGVPQDYKTAMEWFILSAEQGDGDAQFNLGFMYGNGQGVPQDNVYAHMWGNIAASHGNEKGGKLRDFAAKIMTATQIEKAQELAQECVAKKYKGC